MFNLSVSSHHLVQVDTIILILHFTDEEIKTYKG